MGEEYDLGKLVLRTPDGKEVEWNGITETTIDPGSDNQKYDGIFAHLEEASSMSFEIEGRVSRFGWMWMLLGNKGLVKRAIRWYERLRRTELKQGIRLGNKLDLAVQCAKHKSNNGKRYRQPHIYCYTFRMERNDESL